jgi:diacylglycerol O-acyltransferase
MIRTICAGPAKRILGSTVRASMDTPATIFNVPVTPHRRLGTQLLKLSRIKAISKKLGVTVNDVTLAICSGAVRRYLIENDAMVSKSLNASVPIGLPRTDGKQGNAVAGFVAPLATNEPDPLKRVKLINATTSRSKKELLSMSSTALEQFTLMGLAPLLAGQMTGTLSKMPPFFNFVMSNVVLSKHKLYLRGAELEAMYPLSILFDGYALNVTVIGYGEHVCVGFVGCRNAIPHLQNLALYAGEALDELEKAAGLEGRP